jgi:hypothetical protein
VLTAQKGEFIGNDGVGSFIQSGGANEPGELFIGINSDQNTKAVGTFTLTGGTLSVGSLIVVGGKSEAEGAGTLTIEGGMATAATVTMYGGLISLTGAPGSNTFGSLAITGPQGGGVGFQSERGTLNIGIGGSPSSGEFGSMSVASEARDLGALTISFVNGFTPTVGDTYDFFNGGELFIVGGTVGPEATFSSVNSPYPVQLNYSPSGISLTILPEPSSLALLAAGMGLLARRRRPQHKAPGVAPRY